ncbi:MAG: hypothetical protein LBS21_00290 [Clostridiales bacterium]|jgi:N-acetylglucosamine kinase-like BadF-type ATPase|nr:hypothetical protein [Clostridiales bacterium]
MSGLILGVDGGGTKSHLVLFNSAGVCVGTTACGPLNHESLDGSFDELESVLNKVVKNVLKKAGAKASDISHAVFGLAGVDTAAQHKIISDMIDNIGIKSFTLCNDAFLGVSAGCPGGYGICAINGTGSVMAAVDYKNNTVQVGGIGEVSNDCGGSGWYGTKVLGAVYGELFKREKPTLMTNMLFELAGIKSKDEYTEIITEKLNSEELDVYALNRFVFIAAGKGDEAAMDILRTSAAHYSGGIVYLAQELDFPADKTLHVTFAGSVFTKEKVRILPELIEEEVRRRLAGRNAEFLCLDTVPVAGAVYWASKNAGCEIKMEVIKNALKEAGL